MKARLIFWIFGLSDQPRLYSRGYDGIGCVVSAILSPHVCGDVLNTTATLNLGGRMANHTYNSEDPNFEITSKRRKGFPSEKRVKRGLRIVHGQKELKEKLGRNDLCPCGSGRRFQEVLYAVGQL